MQPFSVARDMREGRFSVGAQRHNPARHPHFHALGTQLLRGPLPEVLYYIFRRVSRGILVRIGIVP